MGSAVPEEEEDVHEARTEEIRMPAGGVLDGLAGGFDSHPSESDVRALDSDSV
jgi:hypothetical protein